MARKKKAIDLTRLPHQPAPKLKQDPLFSYYHWKPFWLGVSAGLAVTSVVLWLLNPSWNAFAIGMFVGMIFATSIYLLLDSLSDDRKIREQHKLATWEIREQVKDSLRGFKVNLHVHLSNGDVESHLFGMDEYGEFHGLDDDEESEDSEGPGKA